MSKRVDGPVDPYLGGRDTTAPPDGADCPECGAGSFDGVECLSCGFAPLEDAYAATPEQCMYCMTPLDSRRPWRRGLDGAAAHDSCIARYGR